MLKFCNIRNQETLNRYPRFSLNNIMGFMFLKRTNEDNIYVHHRNGIKWNNSVFNIMWTSVRMNQTYTNGRATKVIVMGKTGEDEET